MSRVIRVFFLWVLCMCSWGGQTFLPCAWAGVEFHPFKSKLPAPIEENRVIVEEKSPEVSLAEVLPEKLSIEGVIWGSDRPQAIIEGKVYSVGDSITLADMEVKIVEIHKGEVTVDYQGARHTFEMKAAEITSGQSEK